MYELFWDLGSETFNRSTRDERRTHIFFFIIFLGGIFFFFTIDFKNQSEEVIESIDLDSREVVSKEGNQASSTSSSVKKMDEEKKQENELSAPSEKAGGTKADQSEGQKGDTMEFELDPQYYPSLGGYLKIDGGDIQALENFFRETDSFVVNLSFTKVTNSIFQVENSFWNLHRNPDGLSYNLRVGNGPLSGNILTFTPKEEGSEGAESSQFEESQGVLEGPGSEDFNSYEEGQLDNDEESPNFSDDQPSYQGESDDGAMENSAFE